jgi:hypothetical protein
MMIEFERFISITGTGTQNVKNVKSFAKNDEHKIGGRPVTGLESILWRHNAAEGSANKMPLNFANAV